MENAQLLFTVNPREFYQEIRSIVKELLAERQASTSAPTPETNHQDRPLLKATEVCSIFKVSKPTLYDWLKQGKISSIKIQSRRYFHWQDVEALIEKSKVSQAAI